ncbi:hypothetical protein ILUMI_03568 [Ignelater luminosus]|uniref:Ig-like domain-containing protein n=1 Tax=Ignelater luminosus TaxID=2038154 RepID=A0A8K0DEE1_IGNLU|nr:hypothetical protein ILUMI_03568 [Ignelater luminosus]
MVILIAEVQCVCDDHVVTSGLKDVSVTVPQAATVGDTVTLQCRYNLEGEPLYTVKWYKGQSEFYRYLPKELPNTQVFPLPGIDVDYEQKQEAFPSTAGEGERAQALKAELRPGNSRKLVQLKDRKINQSERSLIPRRKKLLKNPQIVKVVRQTLSCREVADKERKLEHQCYHSRSDEEN